MDTKKCKVCEEEKPLKKFVQKSPTCYSHTCRKCEYDRVKKLRESYNTEHLKVCLICEQQKSVKLFAKIQKKILYNNICQECYWKQKKEYKMSSWDTFCRYKITSSLSAHNNKEKINPLSIEEGKRILEAQEYKCAHCKHELIREIRSVKERTYWGASLDRIDTNIIGYGNGNAQWLCMSCNNGKCTMPNEEHLNKFKLRDDKIKELEQKIKLLESEINELRKFNA